MWQEAEVANKQQEETKKRVQEALKVAFGSSSSSPSPPVSPPADEPSPSPPQSPTPPTETHVEEPSSSLKQISSVEVPQKIPSPEPQEAVLPKITMIELPKARLKKQIAPEVVQVPQRDGCEAEYRAVFTATVECVWLRRLMADSGVGQDTANTIYTDSQSALVVARNPIFHARTKHIEVHYHYVKERLSIGEINLAYVPTQDNLADLFTKALSREKIEAFRKALGLLPFVD
ncbi:hypothetical protein L7F22_004158 [Adiantum nelumboides]|nr:hypothetical protein [Adiantum nelumboides]